MHNDEIKKIIRQSRFFNYEIAEIIGITEYTFSKWFRKPLSQRQIDSIIKAISTLKGVN